MEKEGERKKAPFHHCKTFSPFLPLKKHFAQYVSIPISSRVRSATCPLSLRPPNKGASCEHSHFLLNPDQNWSAKRPPIETLPWDLLGSGRGLRGKKSHFRFCHLDWLALSLSSFLGTICMRYDEEFRRRKQTKLSHFPPFYVMAQLRSTLGGIGKNTLWQINVPIGPAANGAMIRLICSYPLKNAMPQSSSKVTAADVWIACSVSVMKLIKVPHLDFIG